MKRNLERDFCKKEGPPFFASRSKTCWLDPFIERFFLTFRNSKLRRRAAMKKHQSPGKFELKDRAPLDHDDFGSNRSNTMKR